MESKKCTCCNLEFPKTEDYFFARVRKQQNKSGLAVYYSFRSICKSCNNKKTEANRIKKRCKEMNCDVLDYRKNWKKQYSKTRTKNIDAKLKLTTNQYSRFLKSGLNDVNLFKQKIKKSKEERDKRLSNIAKASRKYFTKEDKRNALNEYYKKDRLELKDAYIANNILGFKVSDVPKEIIETKRLIIQLKKQLNYGS